MNRFLAIACCLCLFAAVLRADNPATVVAAPTGKPNFMTLDTLVLNLNAVAGIGYNTANSGGTLTVTYLNGVTTSYYSLKISPAEWSKVQAEIVSAGNK